MPRTTAAAFSVMGRRKGWNDDDFDNQDDPRDIDSFSDAPADICYSERWGATRCTISVVSIDCWGVGDLRLTLCEIEVESR